MILPCWGASWQVWLGIGFAFVSGRLFLLDQKPGTWDDSRTKCVIGACDWA
ncbi:hypothetical protein ABH945_001761 [Paraburkholderia sp. GAS333]